MKDKMKREKRDHKIVILCTGAEYNTMKLMFKKTTCRSLPEYARKTMMHKPVAVTYRNRSIDDLIETLAATGQQRDQPKENYQLLCKIHDQCMLLLRSRKVYTESSTTTSEN